jgi:hypothetical protein
LTVAKLTGDVVSCVPDTITLPVIASAPLTTTGRLLVVTNFPSNIFPLAASLAFGEFAKAPFAKTKTLTTAARTSNEENLTGRVPNRMVFTFLFLRLHSVEQSPVSYNVLWGSCTLSRLPMKVKHFLIKFA